VKTLPGRAYGADTLQQYPFFKPKELSYQNEFRFHLENPNEVDIDFKIGPLDDIAILLEVNDISTMPIRAV